MRLGIEKVGQEAHNQHKNGRQHVAGKVDEQAPHVVILKRKDSAAPRRGWSVAATVHLGRVNQYINSRACALTLPS